MRGFSWFSPIVLAALGSVALSTIFSSNPALSLFGTAWRRYGALSQASILAIAFLIATHIAGRVKLATAILRGISASALFAAMYGIAQYCGWDPLLPVSAYHIGEGLWTIVRPPGTLGYSSYYAVWLDMACFASLAGLKLDTNVTWRWIAGASARGIRVGDLTKRDARGLRWPAGRRHCLARLERTPRDAATHRGSGSGGPAWPGLLFLARRVATA